MTIHVPTPNVSAVDLVFMLEWMITGQELNALFRMAAAGALRGIMEMADKPLVSADLSHCPASVTIHLDQTKVMPDGMVRLFGWYNNKLGLFLLRAIASPGCVK